MKNRIKFIDLKFNKNIDYLFIILLFFILYRFIIFFLISDIPAHIQAAIQVKENVKTYTPNFLFFYLLNLLSFHSTDTYVYDIITIFLLTFATFLKYYISKKYLYVELKKMKIFISQQHLIIATLLLFFCFSIPDFVVLFISKLFFLGRAAPFVLHNSTTIFLFPVAIFLFIKQMEIFKLKKISNRNILVLFILIILNALIKPSFLFAYLPVSSIYILYFFYKDKLKLYEGFKMLLPMVLGGGIFVLLQIILLYKYQYGEIIGSNQKNGIAISFFHIYENWMPIYYFPIIILFSFAFPIALTIFYKEILKFKPFLYSIMLLAFGYIIALFFYETGPREYHGNFTWQIIICTYLVFMTSVVYFYKIFSLNKLKPLKDKILFVILLLHFLSGLFYIFKYFITKSYF